MKYKFVFCEYKDVPKCIQKGLRADQYLLCYKGDKLAGFAKLLKKDTYCHYFIYVLTKDTLFANESAKTLDLLILEDEKAKGIITKLIARLEHFVVNNWKMKKFYCCTRASFPRNYVILFLTKNRQIIESAPEVASFSGIKLVERARAGSKKTKADFWCTIGGATEGIFYKL